MNVRPLDTLSADDFSAWLGDGWRLTGQDGAAWPLQLAEAAVTLPRPYQPGGRLPFRLLFEGPPTLRLPQGLYRAAHAGFGETELFLVPLQPAGHSVFEAVFS